jgi:hypothetical protein
MGRFTLKTALLGLASVLLASSSLFAVDSKVDDHEDGTNQNDFLYYWYYYDDNSGLGINDRPQVETPGTPSVINVEFEEKNREAYGNPNDTWKVKEYTFTVGDDGSNKYATMPFTFGSSWKASYGTAYPYVGIGTMLTEEGKSLDLTGATAVSFRIKGSEAMSVDFKIQTKDIDDDSTFGYYQSSFDVTDDWQQITINIADLAQPAWAQKDAPFDFDITQCTKLAWEVKNEFNMTVTEATLDIDDVWIIDYEWVSPFIWTDVVPVASSTLPATGLFSNFDVTPANASPLGTYWYAYNDVEIGGTSTVLEGALPDEETGRLLITITEGAAKLLYALGPTIDKGGVSVQAFIGIGCNLYDSATARYWNATAAGANSVYFHYYANSDLDKITVEISDNYDVADVNSPTKTISDRGDGVLWFIDLPATGDEWYAVEIPFSALKIHESWEGANAIPFNATKMAKLQFKVQGPQDASGYIGVDNIYFPGVSEYKFTDGSPVLKPASQIARTSGLKVNYLNGKVNVNWNGAKLAKGKISLINSQGAVFASSSIKNAAKLSETLSASKLAAGMYFVKFNATDVNGKAINIMSPVQVVK